jgi:uncharacterized caspase-like protein
MGMKTAFFALLTILALTLPAGAAERRIALVVGNANYQTGSLPTPANDAGLVAQTLQAAGFDVTGARDLDQESLRRAFRDFLDKSSSSGPDTVAYIYLSGYGVQLEGENYFVPVDARIANDTSVSAEALRLSDYIRPLSALHLKSVVIVLDLARANPFARSGNPLTGGLALVDAEPGTLIAFNAAPGTIAPDVKADCRSMTHLRGSVCASTRSPMAGRCLGMPLTCKPRFTSSNARRTRRHLR